MRSTKLKFLRNSENFAQILILRNSRKISRKFGEIAKTKIFVATLSPPRPRPSKFIHTHLSLTLTKHTHHTHSQQTLTTYTYLPQTLATHPTHHIFRHSTQAHTPTLTHHTAHSPHNTLTTHLLLTHHIHTPHTKQTLTTNVLLPTLHSAPQVAGPGGGRWSGGRAGNSLI